MIDITDDERRLLDVSRWPKDAADEIVRLTAERDAALASARQHAADARLARGETAALVEVAHRATAERDAELAKLAMAREALQPFAKATARDAPIFGDSSHELISTTLGDLRRARAALAAIDGDSDA